jgi:YHS domain-containing protein
MMAWTRIGMAAGIAVAAWGQPAITQADATSAGPLGSLRWPDGAALADRKPATPYLALHFSCAHGVLAEYARQAPRDAGVTHLLVDTAQTGPEAGGDQLVRVVSDVQGSCRAALRVEERAHTIVILDRRGREIGRTTAPATYAAFSEAYQGATRAPALAEYNVAKGSRLALDGYDPVSYFKGGAAKGSASIESRFRGVTYRFADEANRSEFARDPEKYLPTYGGWCASAMGDKGTKVEVDPRHFKVKNGRLFLFYKSFLADARADWNKHEKAWEPAADRNWKKLTGEDPVLPE